MKRLVLKAAVVGFLIAASEFTCAQEWKIGLARIDITPSRPTWLSGYSSRDKPAQGKVHDLFAKCAAFEGSDGTRLVLITCDLGSMYQDLADSVAGEARMRFGLPPGNLVINVSHTHCAPEIAKERTVFHDLSADEEAKLDRYIHSELQPKLVELIGAAIADLKPAELLVNQSSANFANNRRVLRDGHIVGDQNPAGVGDHDVPVLQIVSPNGRLRGVLFGYACHNTTLSFYEYCGDYAGFAQQFLEAAHPGVTAMFVMGCGGDQNPYPRHGLKGLEYCCQHGHELANAVESSLKRAAAPVHGQLHVAHAIVRLALEPLPPIERLKQEAAGPCGHPKRKARYLLGLLKKGQSIPLTQTCPVAAARLGNELLMIFIGGETVVDYSRRSKAEFAGPLVWVAGYCNDVFAYLPSLRVLKEGGYEGRTGIIHQLVATPFAPSVEERVMAGVRAVVSKVSRDR